MQTRFIARQLSGYPLVWIPWTLCIKKSSTICSWLTFAWPLSVLYYNQSSQPLCPTTTSPPLRTTALTHSVLEEALKSKLWYKWSEKAKHLHTPQWRKKFISSVANTETWAAGSSVSIQHLAFIPIQRAHVGHAPYQVCLICVTWCAHQMMH